jgi:hypothetical protein
LACSTALQGKRDEAIIALGDALAHGLRSSEAAGIGEDEDFKSLHGDPRFEALVAKSKTQVPAMPLKPD